MKQSPFKYSKALHEDRSYIRRNVLTVGDYLRSFYKDTEEIKILLLPSQYVCIPLQYFLSLAIVFPKSPSDFVCVMLSPHRPFP